MNNRKVSIRNLFHFTCVTLVFSLNTYTFVYVHINMFYLLINQQGWYLKAIIGT